MNILVTGAAGFIGSNLVHFLLGKAEKECGVKAQKVVVLDKLTYAGNPANLASLKDDPRYVFVQGDITDSDLVSNLLRTHGIETVIHLAAESHVDRSIDASEDFIRTNIVGTHCLLDASLHYFSETESDRFRFIHVSTDEVFGSLGPDDPPFTENTPYAPNSPYSASKAASDHLARAWFRTYGLPVITTNCSNNYGPYQFPEKLIPLMIGKALKGEQLPVYGNGQNIRDWLYVEDHCRGLVRALIAGKPGQVYHFGGDCEKTNLEIIESLLAAIRMERPDLGIRPSDELIEFVDDRPGHDQRYAVDTAKAHRELAWEPKETFESGLRKTVLWYLERQDWVRDIEEGTYRGERLGRT